jgi:Carboxypeptidase regulatory-like domain/TonB dependent receptor/TonB-dependent Receptor Plug Domain
MKEKDTFDFWGSRIAFCVALLLLFTVPSFAQSDTARVEGTVTDTTGAVVPGAAVVLINTESNIRTDATANNEGFYVVQALRVGTYTLEVSASNFKKFVKPDIILQVNQVARIDAKLEAGTVSETVTVSGGAPLVETSQSSLGQVINAQKIVDLPLNGRNFTQLATLVPGVTRGTPGGNATGEGGNAETFRQGENGSAAISANGLREQNNNFQLDGIDNNESIVNTIVFFPPVEALQEFRVLTSVAPAEFGRGGGAIINAVIKSGSNDFHGSAFEFHRNSKLDARPFFAREKPLFIRHQFGGTIGGPIVRNKTFFFGDYQGLRQRLPIESGNRVTVPTAKMRTGDFSELLNPAFTGLGAPIIIHSPITGLPYPGNIITDPLNPVAVKYLNLYPLPSLTDRAQGNFFVNRLRVQKFNDADLRIDHRFNDNDSMFGRFSIARDRQFDPGRIPGFQAGFGSGTNRVKAHSLALNETHTFSPSLVNEFRFGITKQFIQFLPVGAEVDQNAQVGIAGIAGVSPVSGISLIGGGNGQYLEYLGDFGEYRLDERSLQFSDSLNYVTGHHTFKFGGTIIQRHIQSLQADFAKGFYFFDDFAATPGNVPALGRTGYEVADMIVGRTAFTTTSNGAIPATTISYEDGFFVQDDWHATNRLTLNLGLRYDLYTPPYEINNRLANFDPATGKLILAGENGVSRSTVDTDRNNFGPRLGLAYSLGDDGKTVIRGGWGLFYSLDRGGIANQLTQNPPFITTQFRFAFGTVTPAAIASGAQVLLGGPIPKPDVVDPNNPNLPDGSALRYMPRDTKNTRVQQFNVTFERELTDKLALNVAYVGTRGDNVTAVISVAGFSGGILGRLTTIANIGKSEYNAFQLKVNLRPYETGLFRGLSYLAAYTYGKATNNSPGPFPGQGANFQSTPVDPGGLAPGPTDYDVRHRFTFAGTYEVPFFSETHGAKRAILHGWQLNSIVTLQTGTPFSVFGGVGRAKLVGDPFANTHTPDQYLNPAAFAPSTTIAEQSGRNAFYAPGISNVDFSIFRKFNFNERAGLEFRGEFFNLFNHPQFGFPNQFCCGGDFGKILTVRGNTERQIQLGLRLFF